MKEHLHEDFVYGISVNPLAGLINMSLLQRL